MTSLVVSLLALMSVSLRSNAGASRRDRRNGRLVRGEGTGVTALRGDMRL